jgi:hypothetical protein
MRSHRHFYFVVERKSRKERRPPNAKLLPQSWHKRSTMQKLKIGWRPPTQDDCNRSFRLKATCPCSKPNRSGQPWRKGSSAPIRRERLDHVVVFGERQQLWCGRSDHIQCLSDRQGQSLITSIVLEPQGRDHRRCRERLPGSDAVFGRRPAPLGGSAQRH